MNKLAQLVSSSEEKLSDLIEKPELSKEEENADW